ncbi:spermidine synthase [Natrinema longum]|uniref:Spermidine synthase n=1 Tax=Natrinema longum TaxID=370324 RepID=A0A8A2UDA6_9EURY|nr:spermidine synthase [Natrinema longum]MBZ6495351.1 spermidine synthase [Natrinema longum]QSW86676.1 spermidine synthase [Natrinema longum]
MAEDGTTDGTETSGSEPTDGSGSGRSEGEVSSRHLVTDRRVALSVTFVVAFCSIAYELVYSELLTVFFGGTVLRYSITIGLYMFSLGVGSVLSAQLGEPESNFLRTEVYLAIAGPAGAMAIVAINSLPPIDVPGAGPTILALSHVPILVVGVLSGFEVPLLTDLVENREETVFASLGRLYPRRIVRAILGAFFTIDDPDNRSFSEVLGVDYLGSLAGTVVYALVLYPRYGLVVSVFALGLLNALAALGFAAWTFSNAARTLSRPTVGQWRAVVLVGVLLTGTYGGLVAHPNAVDRAVTTTYLERTIEREYPPGVADVETRSYDTTSYQTVLTYERDVQGHTDTETCLHLDRAIQFCDRWVDSYHSGLVDIPMTTFDDQSSVDVLLVGGGDYIAVDHLRQYDASVDQVDIDGEFLEMAREREFFRQYNDDAYEYDRLNTTTQDAFTYLQESDETYDLVLLDVPGVRSDETMSLYSTEFYTLLREHLSDDGLVVSWVYTSGDHPTHSKVYANTVRAAGFDQYLPYYAYDDLDGDGGLEPGERFYVLSDGPTPTPDLERAESDYVHANAETFGEWRWRSLPEYRGVEPNSVLHPNYDIIVD